MTKELEKKFAKFPLYSQEDKGFEAEVVVKYFNPCGLGTWLITEGEKQEDGDWLFFGYCHLFEWEWGYVTLGQLEEIQLPFDLTIERDLHTNDKHVKDYI
jgi:hypothetical protein